MSVEELDVVVALLDVGHGDAAVLRFRDGHQVRTIVVDGGGPERAGVLLSYLLRNSISTVDLMVATHVDRAHIAGLIPVVESDRVSIHNFWGPVCESTQPSVPGLRTSDERTYQRLYSRITQRVRPERVLCPTRGMPLPQLSSMAALTVLNPTRPNVLKPTPTNAPQKKPAELALEQNELALVLHFESHGLSLLLTSDVEGPFWATVAGDGSLQRYLDVHVLKIANYGRPSGFPPSVARHFPEDRAVVFSVGTEADQEPSREVLDIVRDLRAQIFCTGHAPDSSFCRNHRCAAGMGGQNIVFFAYRGAKSFPPGGEACTIVPGP